MIKLSTDDPPGEGRGDNDGIAHIRALAESAMDAELDRAALSKLGEPVILVNNDGEIVRVNEQASMLTEYPPIELIGQKIEILVPGMKRQAHVAHRERYMTYPQPRQMGSHLDVELVLVTKTSHALPVRISLAPLLVGSGRYISAVIWLKNEVRG